MNKVDLLLYGITDSSYRKLPVAEQVRAAIKGGATIIQLREKNLSTAEYADIAREVLRVTREYGVPLIINDNWEAAKLSGADGVHLGQSDGDPAEVRKYLGDNAVIGVTAKTLEQAVRAEQSGADYLGSGAMFVSPTKPDAVAMTKETLSAICSSVNIPVCAIGGITSENAHTLAGTGIKGLAVVSSLFGSENVGTIEKDAKKLYETARVIVGE